MSTNNRYLKRRGDTWYYQRGVPASMKGYDHRGPMMQISLKTSDKKIARKRRDGYAQADSRFWEALKTGESADDARERYEADVEITRSMGFDYRQRDSFDNDNDDDKKELTRRVFTALSAISGTWVGDLSHTRQNEIANSDEFAVVLKAVTGSNERPSVTVSDAFEIYVDEIAVDDQRGMNSEQLRTWKKTKQRAVNNFTTVVRDKPILEITREDAKDFYKWWRARVTPPADGQNKPLSASAANRDIGNMRKLFGEYARYMGDFDIDNPFRDLGFKKQKATRPAFSIEWVKTKFLKGNGLLGLNDEARHIFLLQICFGNRPSEIVNLAPSQIHLEDNQPYIDIAAIDEGEHKRAIKNGQSERKLPLTGMALVIMRKHPEGFTRYRGKANGLSQVVMKHLKTNDLLEGPDHKAYSIRHFFEDLMKQNDVGDDMRRELMGHSIDRPEYGSGYSLEKKREALERIALPYNKALI